MHIVYWWESQKERDRWGRPRCRWVDNIKMELGEIGWDGMAWIDLALVNMVLNLRVPKSAGNFLSGCTIVGPSRRAQLRE
jgi:hypothetical protein